MPLLTLQDCHVIFRKHYHLKVSSVQIQALQHCVILGANGSGKSALAALMAGEGDLKSGERDATSSIAWVSVEQQQALIEAEDQKDCADILDVIPEPTLVKEILFQNIKQNDIAPPFVTAVLDALSLQAKLEHPFRGLSTGETRKLLLANAILQQPKMLILDEPWDGLDTQSSEKLNNLLQHLSASTTIVFVLNRLSEIPAYIKHLILMQSAAIHWQIADPHGISAHISHIKQVLHLQQSSLELPGKDADSFAPPLLNESGPLVKLNKVKVAYQDNLIFEDLDWTIEPQQHWRLSGPNGSGKTCLLNLITGDHPQCYVNDIYVFGYQRGNGESIWQIKQYIGYISNALHLSYKVGCSLLNVILSGFYDSIGLYKQATEYQVQLAQKWLSVMGLSHKANDAFHDLSFGDQRVALIARAMVKHPALLILDEPCNGLDDINRIKVLALIELLAREGNTTILYVNHHLDDQIPSIQNHFSLPHK
ncbi:ATP-binding cassette domain-containing protein [Glaciecola sp. 2405UD65-10]|uniref:ATP-binding cassette domain-containing protein n=1 Tax=Glaciecola sp. 2405UD65-10 TaxID=3397244 RepID=UPI003B5CEDA3